MTRGADGVVIHDRDGSPAYPAHQVPVVDTTGAGDAFAAGFLYQIAVGALLRKRHRRGLPGPRLPVQSLASIPPPWQVVRDGIRDVVPKWR